jgi:hypothetical protein
MCWYDKYFREKMQTLKNQPHIPPAFAILFVDRPSRSIPEIRYKPPAFAMEGPGGKV